MSAFTKIDPRQRRILSPRERDQLRNRIEAKKRELRGEIVVAQNRRIASKEGRGMDPRRLGRYSSFIDSNVGEDKQQIMRDIRRAEAILARGTPEGLSKGEKAKLEKQAAADREFLRSQMCPKSLYYKGYKDPEFEKAKKACLREHEEKFTKVAERYKNSMRRLDPDSADAASIEKIRPE